MRVLVTGCSGRLGDALVAALLEHPLVRCVAGTDVRAPRRPEGPRFRYYPADIRDGVYLRSVMEDQGVEAVYHLAFKADPAAARLDAATVNVDGTLAALEAASKAAHVRKLVVLSSAYVYGTRGRGAPLLAEDAPLATGGGGPALWRRRMEETVARALPDARASLQVSVVRACAVAGGGGLAACPLLPFLGLGAGAKPPGTLLTLLAADPPVQFLALGEAVRALARILDAPEFRGAYNLAPDDAVALSALARRLGGTRLRLPYPALWAAAWLARRFRPAWGLAEWDVRWLSRPVVADNRKLKRALAVEFPTRSEDAFAAAYLASPSPPERN